MVATAVVAEELDGVRLRACAESGHQATEIGSPITGISGVKRSRETIDNEQHPSVRVIYNSLTRESISKLQELLQQWSEWHSQNCSSDDYDRVLECGEKTYFPALHVGLDKPSVVFWMDDKGIKTPNEEISSKDNGSAPIYDREYTFVLTSSDTSENHKRILDVANAPRCFNCNSYNHSLKECSKPRDNIAVSNARKHRKTIQNQSASAINKIRYYQNTPGGKYDDLRPGVLGAETQKALGLGELEPPPWLNRMRELGYPPGYLVNEDENSPSGIKIFADKENSEEGRGEITETGYLKSQESRKMTVEFPGLNAPVPPKADKRLWTAGDSCVNTHDGISEKRKFNISLDRSSREHFHEQRWFRDLSYDDRPPRFSPGMDIYPPRYGGYNDRHHLDGFNGNPIREYPLYERSFSDIGLKGLLAYEEFPRNHSHHSFHFSPPCANLPMTSFGPASLETSIGSSRIMDDAVKLMKCSVIECSVPVWSIRVSFGYLLLGEENGVRMFALRPLVKGLEKKDRQDSRKVKSRRPNEKSIGKGVNLPNGLIGKETSIQVSHTVGTSGTAAYSSSGDQSRRKIDARCGLADTVSRHAEKLKSMKLRQESAGCFVTFHCPKTESSKSSLLMSAKAISMHALSPTKFIILDSLGNLHLLRSSNVGVGSKLSFHAKQLCHIMSVQKLAVFADISTEAQTVWLSDGKYSLHLMTVSELNSPAAAEKDDPNSEEKLILPVDEVIFTGEKIQDIVPLSTNAISVLGQGNIFAYAIS